MSTIHINKYNKGFFTIPEMEYVLQQRGLIIDDHDIFEKINYAYLIYEFSDIFYDSHLQYKTGTRLSDIIRLYEFNKLASEKLFGIFHVIEQKFKKHIITSISSKNYNRADEDEAIYGYLDKTNYNSSDTSFNRFFDKIKRTHKSHIQKDTSILSGKMKNNISPLWIFINQLSMGDLIKLLRYYKKIGQNYVYQEMKINWQDMSNINKYRNQVAHMNPVKDELPFFAHNKIRSLKWSDLRRSLFTIIPDVQNIFDQFWDDNKQILPDSIRDEIYNKYFK